MNYKIIEVHQVYKDGKLSVIATLWQSNENGWVRASYFTDKLCAGYGFLIPSDKVSSDLIQRVAGQGMNLPDNLKEQFFPGTRKWER